MSSEPNPYAVSPATTSVLAWSPPSFGRPLKLALAVPILAVVAAVLVQSLIRFPVGSPGASLTAIAVMIGLAAEIVPVSIAVVRLVRNPHLRSRGIITLTSTAALLLLLGLLLFVALAFRS